MSFQLSAENYPVVRRQEVARICNIGKLSLAILAFALGGCSLEPPEAPKWTINLTVPLADRHYDVPYIIEHADQPELVWDSLSGARFELVRTLDTIFVGDHISFGDLTQSFADSLGPVALHPQQTLSTEIGLGELYTGPPGQVPAFAAQVEKELPPLVEMDHAVVIRGALRLHAANNSGLAIDSLQVAVSDMLTGNEIGQVVFPVPIADQDARSVDLDLAGKTINSRFRLAVQLHTPGGLITTVDGKSIEITVGFPDSVTVSQAAGVIPPLSRMWSDTIDFSHTIRAAQAVFQRGTVDVQMHNGTQLAFTVLLCSGDVTRDGQPVCVAGTLAPASSTTLSIPLEHAAYRNHATAGARLQIGLNLQTAGSAEIVHIGAADRFDVVIHIVSPIVESLTGVLPATVQAVEGLQAAVDLPAVFENAGLAGGELRLEVLNSLPFPGSFDLLLTGNRGQSLLLAGEMLPAPAGQPLASAITVADAASLLNPIPTRVAANGTVIYGDGITYGTVGAADFMVPTFRVVAPLSVYLNGVHHVGEVRGVKLSGESDELRGRLGAASITVEFENHLPFGVTIEVRLADQRSDLPDNPDLVLGPTEIPPAQIDNDGRAVQPVTFADVFTVAADRTYLFERDSVFVVEEILLLTPEGRAVTMQDNDYVHWRALLQLEAALGAKD